MTEVWKTIPGYERLYEISSMGRIKSLRTGLLRRDVNSGRGYRAIQLSDSNAKKHRLYVHRLVALAFLGPPPSEEYQVNHINLVMVSTIYHSKSNKNQVIFPLNRRKTERISACSVPLFCDIRQRKPIPCPAFLL